MCVVYINSFVLSYYTFGSEGSEGADGTAGAAGTVGVAGSFGKFNGGTLILGEGGSLGTLAGFLKFTADFFISDAFFDSAVCDPESFDFIGAKADACAGFLANDAT